MYFLKALSRKIINVAIITKQCTIPFPSVKCNLNQLPTFTKSKDLKLEV